MTRKHYAYFFFNDTATTEIYTATSLTQLMQDFVNNREAVQVAQAATKEKIETERAQAPSQIAVMIAFERIVRGSFGTSADVLADFGLTLPKARAPLTAEEKAVAAAKRAATRKARGTMGKVQKKAVKGAVSATLVVTPLAAPQPAMATPGPVTTPAQAAPPAPAAGTTPHVP